MTFHLAPPSGQHVYLSSEIYLNLLPRGRIRTPSHPEIVQNILQRSCNVSPQTSSSVGLVINRTSPGQRRVQSVCNGHWAIVLLEQVIARRCTKCSCFILFYVCWFIALHRFVGIADKSNRNSLLDPGASPKPDWVFPAGENMSDNDLILRLQRLTTSISANNQQHS